MLMPTSVDQYQTTTPSAESFDRTTIRIAGTEKPSNPVVIDTSLPTIVSPSANAQASSSPVSEKVRAAYAEAAPKIEPATMPKKKVVARKKPRPQMMPTYEASHAFDAPRVAGLFGGW
jgi:hypothetical protein